MFYNNSVLSLGENINYNYIPSLKPCHQNLEEEKGQERKRESRINTHTTINMNLHLPLRHCN